MAANIAFLCRRPSSSYAIASFGAAEAYYHPCLRSSTAFIRVCKSSRQSHKLTRQRRRFTTTSFIQELCFDNNHTSTDDELSHDNHTCHSVAVLEASPILATSEESPLGLTDKETQLILTLPTLQVQSLQEQEALAATPAHPEGLYALHASFFAGNFIEQIWNFAWPSAVALLHDSLLPVAVVSFVSKATAYKVLASSDQFVIFVSGPWVGAKMDLLPRVFAFNSLSVVQPWFLILVAMQAIERLTGLACGVAFERDWVVLKVTTLKFELQLAGANRPIALAEANAMLCRVDYLCEMTGTLFFGILLSKYSPVTCLKISAAIMIGSLPIPMVLARCTNKLSKNVLERPKLLKLRELLASQSHFDDKSSIAFDKEGFQMLKHGWLQYLSQPTLPVSLAAVFLYFNIGLAPGSLMTTFLIQKGLNPSIIGVFNGIGALMGLGATFLSATLVHKLGLLRAGAMGLVFQAFLLAVAVLIYWSKSMTHLNALLFFLAVIVLSRLGQFTYDIVGAQILQTAVHPSQANTIGTTEVSLASLAELVMLGVAIVANDVSHFGNLAALSMTAVVGAAAVYHRWMSKLSISPSFDFSLNA